VKLGQGFDRLLRKTVAGVATGGGAEKGYSERHQGQRGQVGRGYMCGSRVSGGRKIYVQLEILR